MKQTQTDTHVTTLVKDNLGKPAPYPSCPGNSC